MIQRNQELEQLYDLVMSRESVLLHAPSGMGKTHTINQLSKKLEGRRICFNLQLRALQHEGQLLHHLLKSLKWAGEERSNLAYQLKRIFEERPLPEQITPGSVARWIEGLLVGLQNVSLDFLFVFEDIDQWEGKGELSDLLVHFFRSRNSQPLFTANRPVKGFEQAYHFELEPLTSRKLNLDYSADSMTERVEEVLQLSAGNVRFFLELIAANALSHEPLSNSMQQVLERYHPMFYNFRQRFTDLQWRLLRAIASEGMVAKPHSFDFLVEYRLGAASSVERALRNLSDTGIIHQSEQGWQVSQIIFQRWLQWLYPIKVQEVKI